MTASSYVKQQHEEERIIDIVYLKEKKRIFWLSKRRIY